MTIIQKHKFLFSLLFFLTLSSCFPQDDCEKVYLKTVYKDSPNETKITGYKYFRESSENEDNIQLLFPSKVLFEYNLKWTNKNNLTLNFHKDDVSLSEGVGRLVKDLGSTEHSVYFFSIRVENEPFTVYYSTKFGIIMNLFEDRIVFVDWNCKREEEDIKKVIKEILVLQGDNLLADRI